MKNDEGRRKRGEEKDERRMEVGWRMTREGGREGEREGRKEDGWRS